MGRFLSEDENDVTKRTYKYAANNPINFSDPKGLLPITSTVNFNLKPVSLPPGIKLPTGFPKPIDLGNLNSQTGSPGYCMPSPKRPCEDECGGKPGFFNYLRCLICWIGNTFEIGDR